ncbi:MAG TPA: type II toxin-antitoxin system VapC family toxin [Candidatus Lokiarchaeia archaeon]|nr:type II toxin-antitoxin system VapC family toxin [Candidatus Lokiarchaeia archaeon]
MVFVDSDIVIMCLQKHDKPENKKAREIMEYLFDNNAEVKMTAYNYAELIRGAYLSKLVSENMQAVENFARRFTIVFSDQESIKIYAQSSATLRLKGEDIGDIDELISSIAIRYDDVFFTRNTDHFNRIPGMKVIDWFMYAISP